MTGHGEAKTGGGAAACPCGTGMPRAACCGPFLDGSALPPTAEALMRSRYCAFVEGSVDYLRDTLHPDSRADFDAAATAEWSKKSEWLGLEIVGTAAGGEGDEQGQVEFVASYRAGGQRVDHRELSTFAKVDGRWYFVDGQTPKPRTFVREEPKAGRNDPCPCGSGKKLKKCCG